MRSPGRPLAASAQSFFGPRFGADFSHVRVHTGPRAEASARSVGARAYAVGPNIVFGRGAYAPESTAGRHLIAHELAHVRQQARTGETRLDRYVACDTDGPCPEREPGEEAASRADPMAVNTVTDPPGILISNFAVGRSSVKPDLATSPDFATVQAAMRARPGFTWDILGFSDCDGTETLNTSLRSERAVALRGALDTALDAQITGARGAPIGDCIQSNATALGRRRNRSAFLTPTQTNFTFEDDRVEAAPAAGPDLYGVTSPASQYFVRTRPGGEIIGRLLLQEMRVEVLDAAGTGVDDLWLQVRFRPADMAAIQAGYAAFMAPRMANLPGLQRRQSELQAYIQALQNRPGMPHEVRPQIRRARESMAPIAEEIQQIQSHQRRLATPFAGRTAWVGAAALGVVAMHYDTFLGLIDAFDRAHASEPLRDRLTRLRQFGEDASLRGDEVVGRGGDLPNRVTQSSRTNSAGWELFFEGKQIRMPDGTFVDAHHFILGLDALALPRADQSTDRVLSSWLVARIHTGESWSSTTWSGDVGGAVGDYVLHLSGSWESANTDQDGPRRLQFYFDTRAPDMDLLADIDAWGAFTDVPRTNAGATPFTSLRQIFEATYGPSRQTASEYTAFVAPRRLRGVQNFLCNYGFGSPTGLTGQTGARARVLDQVRIFATGWYDARAGGGQPVFGRTGATNQSIATASAAMTDIYLDWLEALASTVGLRTLTCNVQSPLQNP